MRHLLLLLLFIPVLALAKVEMFQIVVFSWDAEAQTLQLVSLGSGTAVGSDLILTNKHVVATGQNQFADFLLLCQAQERAGDSVQCNVPAGVTAVHSAEDVALIKPLAPEFFPQVKVSYQSKRAGDSVRVLGFPSPVGGKLGFGDTKTLEAFTAWSEDPTQPLQVIGDKLTVTRGQVRSRLQNTETGYTYTLTDAKVNFGNSGGAAFDEYGNYLGIVTYKDQSGNSIFLEYHQIDDWVKEYQRQLPIFSEEAHKLYQKHQSGVSPMATTLHERLRLLRSKKLSKVSVEAKPAPQKKLTPTQKRLYEYLRSKRAKRD